MDGVHFEVYKSHADERTTTMGNFDFDSMLGHDIPCTCGRTHSTDVQKIYLGSDAIDVLDGRLTLKGLRLIYEKNM